MKRVWVCFLEQGVASGGLDYNALLRANFAAVPHSIPVIALAFVYQVEGQNSSNCFNLFALQVVYFKRLPCTFQVIQTPECLRGSIRSLSSTKMCTLSYISTSSFSGHFYISTSSFSSVSQE